MAMKIRKTIRFHQANDSFVLSHINKRVEAGADFSTVIKELLLQMVTLIEYRETLTRQTTRQTTCQTQPPEEDSDFLDPFADLMK